MVLAKSKNAVGLGNSLMNDRFGRGKGADRKKVSATGIVRTTETGETVYTPHIHYLVVKTDQEL
jgi:large subunit GTPase 1